MQIERLMRGRLQSVSMGKAIDRLRQIKAGDRRLEGVTTKTLSWTTEEQLNLLKSLDDPPPRMSKTGAL